MKRSVGSMEAKPHPIPLDEETLSGLQLVPPRPIATLALAHGAGVGMAHQSMAALAEGLAQRDVATLRFNFPYMEKGRKRPDAPPVAHRAVRAAIAEARKLAPRLPLFAGGRSFGGRMTSQAEALSPTSKLKGLVFFAFPLHAPGKPGIERAQHLSDVGAPMLFLSGTRDDFADLDLLRGVVKKLGKKATLHELEGADHSFRVPAKSGRSNADVLSELLDAARDWMSAQVSD
jgi:predicted alpha/beta-hydrolase family hydrolase